MNHLQEYYRDCNQIDFSLGFKSLPKQHQEELNLIHRIQVLSARCFLNFSEADYSEMRSCIAQYESTYGPYELKHYTKEYKPEEQLQLEL